MKRRSRTIAQLCLYIIALGVTGYQTGESTQDRAGQPEAISLFGKPLSPPPLPEERKKQLEANLARAKTEYEREPDDPDRIIWLGRRPAYLGRFREAIQIYTRGIERPPDYAKPYRHRGHRYITVREFDKAIADLEKAAKLIEGVPDEVELHGMPNKYNIPTNTTVLQNEICQRFRDCCSTSRHRLGVENPSFSQPSRFFNTVVLVEPTPDTGPILLAVVSTRRYYVRL